MNYKDFDFSGVGVSNGNFLGFPYSISDAQIILLPVEWDATTSYSAGTANGPKAIIDASVQLDVVDLDVPNAHKLGMAIANYSEENKKLNQSTRTIAEKVISALENGETADDNDLKQVNTACQKLNDSVYKQALHFLEKDKLVLLIGGDHSTPLGYLKALGETRGQFGILQIDAHADLRDAYEGFEYSHASIMTNALKLPYVEKLTQVGIRDLSAKEYDKIQKDDRINCFFDQDLQEKQLKGKNWKKICEKIVSTLPKQVYISFDIDGLSPYLCPNTGTPVLGGLSYYQAIMLIKELIASGKTIIGADVVEVSPENEGEWNANVGARLVYKMANLMAKSKGLKPLF